MEINSGFNYEEWVDIYKCIVNWEIKIDESNLMVMGDIFFMQKNEVNNVFFKFIVKNYFDWLWDGNGFVMSDCFMWEKVLLCLNEDKFVVMVLLDNFCFDQWKVIEFIFN